MSHRFLPLTLAALLASGCTAITKVDDFESAVCSELRLQLEGMNGPHGDQMVEIRAVQENSNSLSIIVLEPHGPFPIVDIRVPGALEGFGARVDFYADVNDTGFPEEPPNAGPDHSWSIAPDELNCVDQDPSITNVFPHSFDFADLTDQSDHPFSPVGDGAFLSVENVFNPEGAFELQISTPTPGSFPEVRTVGVWRRPPDAGRAGEAAFDLWIPYMIDDGVEYTLTFWNDTNGNQIYDAPPVDEAYVIENVSGEDFLCPANGGCVHDADDTFDMSTLTPSDIGGIYVNVSDE